jgi:serine protease Do
MDDTKITTSTPVEYISKSEFKRTMSFVVVLTLVFATLFGGILGFVGSQLYNGNINSTIAGTSSGIIQNLPVVNQNSAVVSVVKKTNPAVVSIVISQYVSNNNNNPFGNLFGYPSSGSGSGGSGSSGSTKQTVGEGSGFIVQSNGYIITNKHVIVSPTDSYTVVMNNGKNYPAKVVGTDPTNDIAVVKINATHLPTLPLGNSSNLQLGSAVVAIGNALGQYQNTVDTGVISGLSRSVQAQDPVTGAVENLTGMIQTDAEINSGNSGGPLLNLAGQVIGINTAVASTAHGIGFAIPINQAKSDILSALKNGKIIKPELGVDYELITPAIQQSQKLKYSYGAYLVGSSSSPAVLPNTPASRAGLKSHDIILEVNGVKVTETNSLGYLIGMHQLNSTVTLKVYQNGKVQNISVTLNKAFS